MNKEEAVAEPTLYSKFKEVSAGVIFYIKLG
jgi:hypothetical protein